MKYQNQTALITGASSGIGAAFARELAAAGADLVLVARRLDRLEALAKEIESTGRKVSVVPLDLTENNAIQTLATKLATDGVEIDILVNNAGFGTSGDFVGENLDRVISEIELNVTALTALTHTFLPGMLTRNRGTVINLASTAAFQPVPSMAVYGATKAYVLSFTEALWAEVLGSNVKVLALCPGGTETEFFDVAGSKGTGAKREAPIDVVRVALTELTRAKSRPSIVSGSRNRILSNFPRLVSRGLMSKLSMRVMQTD